jgi:23S rRNA pseudouridine1911/1915/1917 synthase
MAGTAGWQRSYLAIVWGVPERPRGTIAAAIDRSSANRQKMAVSRSAPPGTR